MNTKSQNTETDAKFLIFLDGKIFRKFSENGENDISTMTCKFGLKKTASKQVRLFLGQRRFYCGNILNSTFVLANALKIPRPFLMLVNGSFKSRES